jgi:hydroxymethylbilane synthase
LASLQKGSRVGTSSPRRAALIRHLRADLEVVPLRGNVDTRLSKVARGEVDAAVLARAGLRRLGRENDVTEVLDPRVFVPAPGQGALALQVRAQDRECALACRPLEDVATRSEVLAERACVQALGAGCQAPVGAWAVCHEGELKLIAAALSADGRRCLRVERSGCARTPRRLGEAVAQALLVAGAESLVAVPA